MNIIYRTDIAFSIKTLLEFTNFSFLVFNSPGKVNHDSWAALKQCSELTLTENAPKNFYFFGCKSMISNERLESLYCGNISSESCTCDCYKIMLLF